MPLFTLNWDHNNALIYSFSNCVYKFPWAHGHSHFLCKQNVGYICISAHNVNHGEIKKFRTAAELYWSDTYLEIFFQP